MKKLSIPFLLFMLSCSDNQPIEGATWKGTSDFMFITDKTMQMHYASSILSKEVFLNRTYKILKDNSNEVINSLTVVEIEFIDHTDGSKLCRIWGKVDNSKHLSYLLARDCIPN